MSSPVPAEAYPYRIFTRPVEDRVVAGVAAGISRQVRVDVLLVRLVLVFFSMLSGAGLLFYALLWVWTKPGQGVGVFGGQGAGAVGGQGLGGVGAGAVGAGAVGAGADDSIKTKYNASKVTYFLLVIVALCGAVLSFSVVTGFAGASITSFVVVGVGAFVVWSTYDRGLERLHGNNAILVVVGVCLMGVGVVLVAINWESQRVFGSTLVAVIVTLLGVAALGVPLWLRMWDALTTERAESAAAAEREEIASRLHDSVLQTLALIQKRAEDPSEVSRLARSQEREMRQWLFGTQDNLSGGAATIFKAIDIACGEVEDLFSIRITPVTVGADQPLTDATQAAVLASREAMVNAAKHAGVAEIDVYAESLGNQLEIYIRDRGAGFDPDNINPDRHGLRESINGRVERAGGTVKIKTNIGKGTEIVVSMPLGE